MNKYVTGNSVWVVFDTGIIYNEELVGWMYNT